MSPSREERRKAREAREMALLLARKERRVIRDQYRQRMALERIEAKRSS